MISGLCMSQQEINDTHQNSCFRSDRDFFVLVVVVVDVEYLCFGMFLVCVSFEKQNTDYKQTNSENRLWIGLPTHLHFKNTRSITICVYEKLSHISGRWTDFIPKIDKSFLRLQSYFSKRRSGIFNFFCCLEAFIFIIIIYLLLLLLTLNMINFSKWFIKNYTNTKAENSAKLTENKIKIIIVKKKREKFLLLCFSSDFGYSFFSFPFLLLLNV